MQPHVCGKVNEVGLHFIITPSFFVYYKASNIISIIQTSHKDVYILLEAGHSEII